MGKTPYFGNVLVKKSAQRVRSREGSIWETLTEVVGIGSGKSLDGLTDGSGSGQNPSFNPTRLRVGTGRVLQV